ncbi:unnamed protein product [Brachionus calyciflorus]|uniref:Uncharacterized protein n=1 Tax=Brachionus calyciflorus TaxID=104777 RepID=A0A814KXX4_9BILA|nr:unnamed protein product [Brachionus calyciflorus]
MLNNFKNCLTYMIYNGHFNEARLLIENSECDLDETDELWVQKYPKMIRKKKQLISLVPNVSYSGTLNGRTALMLCSIIEDDSWSYSLAQNLIEKGCKLSCKDSYGFNAFMYACLYEKINILDLFLNSPGEYNLYSKDQFGNTCFHLAGLCKTDAICSLLRKIVLKFNQTQTIGKNKFNHSPIDLCRLNNHESCISLDQLSKITEKIRSNQSFRVHFERAESDASIETKNHKNYNTEHWLEFYKFVKNLKEPLIKEFKLKNSNENKIKNDFIEFKNKNKCVITRNLVSSTDHYNLIKRERERVVSDSKKLSRCSSNRNCSSSELDYNKPWRYNLKNLYETLEYQNTRSFRKTRNQSPINLFDQLATGLLLNLQLNNCVNGDGSRRNSLMNRNGKQQSQLLNNSINNSQQGLNNNANNKYFPKTSNSNQIAQNINSTRRTSIMSNK